MQPCVRELQVGMGWEDLAIAIKDFEVASSLTVDFSYILKIHNFSLGN